MDHWLKLGFVGALCGFLGVPAVLAEPGSGIQIGRSVLSPYLSLSLTHDSNAELEPNSEEREGLEDQFLEYRLGVSWVLAQNLKSFSFSGWWYERLYQEFDNLDNTGYGQYASFSMGTPSQTTLTLYQRFERLTDNTRTDTFAPQANNVQPDPVGGANAEERSERDTLTLSAILGTRVGDQTTGGLSYQYSETDYADRDLSSNSSQNLSAQAGYIVTPKSSVFVRGSYGILESESLTEDGYTTSLLGGISSVATEKLSYNIGVGWNRYERDPEPPDPAFPDVEPDPGLEDDGPAYDAAIQWAASHKTSVSASGSLGFENSANAASSVRQTERIQLAISHRLTTRVGLGAAVFYRHEDYSEPRIVQSPDPGAEPELINDERETVGGNLSASYTPKAPWYNVFARASYEDTTASTTNSEYDQFRATIGVRMHY